MKQLKVLHLPCNIRWIMDNLISGQQEMGIATRRFLIALRGVKETESVAFHPVPQRNSDRFLKGIPLFLLSFTVFFTQYLRALMWADIVHWQYSNRFWPKESRFHRLDFALLRLLRKPVVVQFHGSDFRDNKKRIEGSPWWEEAFDAQTREELDRQAAQTQRDFAAADFTFALHYGMMPYVREENKDRVVLLERSVDVAKIKPRVKDDPASPIVIAHSPSNRQTKGTAHILDAIEKLKQKRELHFVLLADLPHDEVIERLAGADIVIDQIIGENYGLASVEALALGKAVVANIGKDMSEIFPSDLPIVSATPETLEAVLVDLIDDHETRIEIAKRGPAYALRRHSLEATMPQALEAYKQAAVRRGRKKLAAQIDAIRKEHEKRSVSDAGRNEGKP